MQKVYFYKLFYWHIANDHGDSGGDDNGCRRFSHAQWKKKLKGREDGWGPAAALVKIILSGDALKLANELELKHFTVNKTRECLPIYTFEEKKGVHSRPY